jgi:hypothetical protein
MLSLHLPNSTTALTDLVVTDLVCHRSGGHRSGVRLSPIWCVWCGHRSGVVTDLCGHRSGVVFRERHFSQRPAWPSSPSKGFAKASRDETLGPRSTLVCTLLRSLARSVAGWLTRLGRRSGFPPRLHSPKRSNPPASPGMNGKAILKGPAAKGAR